jgi:molybdopterin/thiamine biosynthesis adenylyltransferase/ubiquitin-protein ligase
MAPEYHDLSLARYTEDTKQLQRRGFAEVDSGKTAVLGTWQGTITVELDEPREPLDVTFQIAFPSGYPWRKPHCIPIFPVYRRCQHQQPDDVPADDWPNRLCIWPDNTGGWHPSFGIEEIVDSVREWVRATELGWHTRSAPETAAFDLERYFRIVSRPIFFPGGIGALRQTLGTVDASDCDGCMIVRTIDGVSCPMASNGADVLGITSHSRTMTIPYIVCSQPLFPLFADISGLLKELTRQGFDRRRMIQHMGKAIPKSSDRGLVLIAYEAIDARVACGLWYSLPDSVPGFRRKRAPGALRVASAKWARFEASKVVCLDSDTLLRRNPSRMCNNNLRCARIAIFGLGSIGSQIAELLAKGGVGHLLLVDAETIEAGNVIRHTVGLEGMGQSKAIVVKNRLHHFRIDGSFEIPTCASNGVCNVESCADQLSATLADYDILVDCTASYIVQDFLMREAIRMRSHYCRVLSYQGGSLGEVIIADPNGPCAACIEQRAEADPRYAMSHLPAQETTIAEGCASVTQPASAADLAVTCGLAADGLVSLLLGATPSWNLRYWVARPIHGATANSVFSRGPQVHDIRIDMESRCPICHT